MHKNVSENIFCERRLFCPGEALSLILPHNTSYVHAFIGVSFWEAPMNPWQCLFSVPDEENYGPLTRYVKFQVVHAPGMLGTFSPPPWVSDPDMHHGTCVTHVPWCMLGSLTSGFLRSRRRGKRSRHSRRMHNSQFYVSGKRSMYGNSGKRPTPTGNFHDGHPLYWHGLTLIAEWILSMR